MLRTIVALMALGTAAAATAQQAPAQQAPSQPTPAAAQQQAAVQTGPKEMSGMSILGNQEAPKSLVIVPWKSSEIGLGLGVSRALDTRIRAVDKDVFVRELKYYSIRSGSQK